MEIYSNFLYDIVGKMFSFQTTFVVKVVFFSLHRAHENLIPNTMIEEDGEKLNLGEVFGCWETAWVA